MKFYWGSRSRLLVSLLYKASPSEVKLVLILLGISIPTLLLPGIGASIRMSLAAKASLRSRLAAAGARNLEAYNEKAKAAGEYGLQLPYIVVVIDELADLMMAANGSVAPNHFPNKAYRHDLKGVRPQHYPGSFVNRLGLRP